MSLAKSIVFFGYICLFTMQSLSEETEKKSMTNQVILKERPKISVFIATSIDGYIARENGSLDWLDKFNDSGENCGFPEFFSSVDTLIMGRKTYETVLSFNNWPYRGKRVIVISNTLNSVTEDAELYKGDILPLLSKLQAEGVKHIYVDGGETISHFLKEKTVDSITLTTIPVLLGKGIPLFRKIDAEFSCKLVSSQSYSSGITQATYQVSQ
jgi:dihydrofolate reductase